jgi:hypothetical protein
MKLGVYYESLFVLAHAHDQSLQYVESLIPYERDLFYEMLSARIQKQIEDSKKR